MRRRGQTARTLKHNMDLREAFLRSGIEMQVVAQQLGITASAFSHRLCRREMTLPEKREIYAILWQVQDKVV